MADRSEIEHPWFFEIGHPCSSFFPIFVEIGQGFILPQIVAIPNIGVLRASSPLIWDWTTKSDLKKSGKIRGDNTKLKNKRPEKSKSEDLLSDSCGGGCSGAKAPLFAARPRQRWQAECWLYQCVLRNSLAGSFRWFLCPGTTMYTWKTWNFEPTVASREVETGK